MRLQRDADRPPGRRVADMTVAGKIALTVQLLALAGIIVLRRVDGESFWWWLGLLVVSAICIGVVLVSERRRLRRLGLPWHPTADELRNVPGAAPDGEVLPGGDDAAGREQRAP